MSQVGRWTLVEELGRGGVGSVWRARDAEGREAALKLLLAGRHATPAQRERFAREALALTRLRDPGLVAVWEAGEAAFQGAQVPFIAMELVVGEPLEARLAREGPLPPREAVWLVHRLAWALAHAHAQGVLHRDVKPANVLVRPGGEPVLVDFGLALADGERTRLTATGQLMGTPGYWAPEQARGELARIGPWTDVHGLGAVLFALLTGGPPHGESGSWAEAAAKVAEEPALPSSLRPGIDPRVDAICQRALRRDPAARHPDAAALAEELSVWLRGAPGPRRRLLVPGLTAVVLLAGGGVAAALLARPRRSPSTLAPAVPASDTRPAGRDLEQAAWHVDRGILREEQGDLGGALAEYDRALALAPDLARAWGARGTLRATLRDHAGALTDLDRAVALDPSDATAVTNRAVVRQHLGDLPGSLADHSRALELDPTQVACWLGRGQLAHLLGDSQAALSDFDRALALDPGSARAYGHRANVLLALQDLEGALADYDRAIELDPESSSLRFNRAVARRQSGDVEAALADYDRALELEPTYLKGFLNRAECRQALGDLDGARTDLDRAIDVDAGYGLAWASRGAIRLRQGDPEGARQDWLRALELLPADSHHATRVRERLAELR